MKNKRITPIEHLTKGEDIALFVSAIGEVDAIQSVEYKSEQILPFSERRYWKFQWKFPFLVKREVKTYYKIFKSSLGGI